VLVNARTRAPWLALLFVACSDPGGGQANSNNNGNGNQHVPQCGDGVVEGSEACDEGAYNSDVAPDTCRTDCTAPRCGDGVVDTGEDCDRGPGNSDTLPDHCRTDCTAPRCGDGVIDVEHGETCDPGLGPPDERCGPTCRVRFCGNGVLEAGETCDDGNLDPGDGCSADCLSDERCGNGHVDYATGEQCDDGNFRSGDGCSSGCTVEMPIWEKIDPVSVGPREGALLAFDDTRRRLVLVGGFTGTPGAGTETWEYDGLNWVRLSTSGTPPETARPHGVLIHDPVRARLVLLRGEPGGAGLIETWTFDGSTWAPLATSGAPGARAGFTAAFDAGRGRIVLFGGYDASAATPRADTWELVGSAWSQVAPPLAPPARSGHGMAYDGLRGRLVLHGGLSATARLADTWEYDGATWTQAIPAASPPPRADHALAFDGHHGRVTLHGGKGDEGALGDLWTYDGTTWTALPDAGPAPRWNVGLAADPVRRRLVLLGGVSNGAAKLGDTWEHDGVRWTETTPPAAPSARGTIACDPRRDRVYYLADVTPDTGTELWVLQGRAWRRLGPSPALPMTEGSAMTFDARRDRLVSFGGDTHPYSSGFLQDTWEHDGLAWSHPTPLPSPPSRVHHVMAYDAAGGRVVMHGGRPTGTGAELLDTWEYDGTTWERVFTTSSPPLFTWGASLAFAPDRQVMALWSNCLQRLWEYDGLDWKEALVQPAVDPSTDAGLAWLPGRERLILLATTRVADDLPITTTLELDGPVWQPVQLVFAPELDWFTLCGSAARRSVIAFGEGLDGFSTWEYRWRSGHPDEQCTDGQDRDRDERVGCADPDCDALAGCLEDCENGLDDDGNGLVDCLDPACSGSSACVEVCDNGLDDDGDGLIDCLDRACAGRPGCVEVCDNGLDDDGDGLVDCADLDCVSEPGCAELCRGGDDENGNGLVDCADPACDGRACRSDLLMCRYGICQIFCDESTRMHGFCAIPPVFEDIETTGVRLGGADEATWELALPFAFSVRGRSYASVFVHTNGLLTFTAAAGDTRESAPLPAAVLGADAVAAWWDDLDSSGPGQGVYHQTLGVPGRRQLIVQWVTGHVHAPGTIRFQAVLLEDTQHIELRYHRTVMGDVASDHGASATIGVQQGLWAQPELGHGQPTVTDGSAWVIKTSW
jgi:cysteine-rich repeat protein